MTSNEMGTFKPEYWDTAQHNKSPKLYLCGNTVLCAFFVITKNTMAIMTPLLKYILTDEISPEKNNTSSAQEKPQAKKNAVKFFIIKIPYITKSHNASHKVRPTELTKQTELQTKTAECNASHLMALLWQTQGSQALNRHATATE
ncbi:hypothetical protein ACQKP8_26290 [Photobacterium alginatilyticum]|uniref:hypothetical protein n=1 Tax=Photobacterium alginatilyticum TaxID=1775171 RepID=UPI004068F8C7